MRTVNKIISTVALTVGMVGAVNATNRAECSEAPNKITSAVMHLDSGNALLEEFGFRKRLEGRRELRRAVRDIFYAQRALAECGLSSSELVLEEFSFSLMDPFEFSFDLERYELDGQLTNEAVLSVARLLVLRSIKESYGRDDGDAITEINAAVSLLLTVSDNI
ncbi:MAG: hypothetical protein KUG80_03855 [Gammaproteobacteria bacterium]|nr:hypothetical protein [Gammaproteobacteria bacterium]